MTAEGDFCSLRGRRVLVAGARGMVGAALVRRLASEKCRILAPSRAELDLADRPAVTAWFARHRPEIVFLAAARVGGILANHRFPADFLHDNLLIATNVIAAAHHHDVAKLMFFGSSCIYPKHAPQPITEDQLLSGPLEPTNEAYAVAKIAGVSLCQAHRRQHGRDFISVMPTNLYGRGDNFDALTSHVLPALVRKTHEAKASGAPCLTLWGTGTPRRDLLSVDDLADACILLMERYSAATPVNIGSGGDVAIADLARMVAEVVGYRGTIRFDPGMPDGTPRKLLATPVLDRLGWRPRIGLVQGIAELYTSFLRAEAEDGCGS